MSGHTAGPWEARTFMVMGGENMRDRITHVGGNLPPPRVKEAVANATLIAAAPELLEALEDILIMERETKDYAFQDTDCPYHKARLAIAKAKGQPK